MKKKILVIIFLISILFITGCSNNTDNIKFKNEYESLNGRKSNDSKHKYRSVSISKKNKIKYATSKDIIDMINEGNSFVVYFGYAMNAECRSVVEELIRASVDYSIDRIYFVDSHVLEGDSNYTELIYLMDEVSDDEIKISSPSVIVIINGKADKMTTGISSKLTDPYMKLTKDIKNYAYKNFKCMMNCVTDSKNVCTKDSKC